MDGLTIGAAWSSLQTAGQLISGLAQLSSDAKVNAKALELGQIIVEAQRSMLGAQEAQASLAQRIRELEEEVRNLRAWNGEKERYQLSQVGASGVALAMKESMSNGEPPHYICADCAHNFKKVILNCVQDKDQWTYFHCQSCNKKLATGHMDQVAAKFV